MGKFKYKNKPKTIQSSAIPTIQTTTFQQQKPRIELVKRPERFKLVVTENLERIIRHICARFPRNEWSGTLFYTVEGNFEDRSLTIYAKDFYVQDKGEATYTEFQNDVSLAGYMVDHELWECYTGLCHSHNVMAKLNCFNK